MLAFTLTFANFTPHAFISRTRAVAGFIVLLTALFLPYQNAYAGDDMTYWIDVRTQDEFAGGNVEGSVLIPYEVITQHIASVTTDKNADIRVYCRSGRRSEVAKEALQAMGYTNVINEGGYEEIIAR